MNASLKTIPSRPPSPISSNPLYTPVQFLPGVGPHRAQILSKLKIFTVEDLLLHFPREHQNRQIVPIASVKLHDKCAISGKMLIPEIRRLGKQLGMARVLIKDASAQIEAIWFKRLSFKYDAFSALRRDLQPGKSIYLFGQIVSTKNGVALRVDHYEIDPNVIDQSSQSDGIVPVYPLTEGIQEKTLRQLISQAVIKFGASLPDSLPDHFRKQLSLIPLSHAIRQYHSPRNWPERDEARTRLAFDEFFFLELAMELNRQNRKTLSKGFQSIPNKKLLTPFKNKLDYEFTNAQKRVINEIFRDMAKDQPMNRLLQGDVGSGKTIVALSAALLAIENKHQVAFLAPTEILATQHALSLSKIFNHLPVRWKLLLGSTPAAEKKSIYKDLESGKIDLVVGTHAILNDKIEFKQLGLVVIDEQHRFGVRQRSRLIESKQNQRTHSLLTETSKPDCLIMTATPIPRTLALTLYGDLDVSVIDEMPPGRAPVQSTFKTESIAFDEIQKTLDKKQQVFVVFPLIEESELLNRKKGNIVRAAKRDYEMISKRFPNAKVGLIHGQLKSQEKRMVMDAFRAKEISILVATPVIEVGIDIPDATLMVIMSPERFGLSQLHQLRGRVGRGNNLSKCILVPENIEPKSNERLMIFCSISDGFQLAEEDLKLRGPGEFLGEAQHGVPFFKVGNLIKDGLLISQARDAARRLVEGEITMTMKEFTQINRVLQNRFGNKLKLSQIG